jgi:mannose-6-phosphate isomerase
MLHGFRPLEEIAGSLQNVEELRALMPDFGNRLAVACANPSARSALLKDLYERVMTMPQTEVDSFLNPLITRLEKESPTNKDLPDFWALRAAREFPLPDGHRDRGIFSIYLLNLLRLKPGQATFQSAGTLHAYLEGVNVELMANSDNVLRGGLTPKNVDVPELMRVLRFDEGKVDIIHGRDVGNGETIFPTPAEEFELSRIQCGPDGGYQSGRRNGPDILIVMEGEISASSHGETLTSRLGNPFSLPRPRAMKSLAQAERRLFSKRLCRKRGRRVAAGFTNPTLQRCRAFRGGATFWLGGRWSRIGCGGESNR